MIELRDSVLIRRPPEVVWAWLEAMPDHYLEWHPDHVSCRWEAGSALVPGASMAVEERLHGKLHQLTLTVEAVDPGRSFTYTIQPGMSGRFNIGPFDGGTQFTASLRLGLGVPIVGAVVDALLGLAMRSRIESFRRHQGEEGLNLKALLEAPSG